MNGAAPIYLHSSAEAVAETKSGRGQMPFVLAMAAAAGIFAVRLAFGGERFIGDEALMMLALAAYLTAAIFYLTNFYAPFRFAERLGLWAAGIGVALNLAS